jgi:hypothetical protein
MDKLLERAKGKLGHCVANNIVSPVIKKHWWNNKPLVECKCTDACEFKVSASKKTEKAMCHAIQIIEGKEDK